MAIEDRFSPVEWSVLAMLPERIIASAIMADPPADSLDSIREGVSGLSELTLGASQRQHSELVQEVFAAYLATSASGADQSKLSQHGIDNFIPETLSLARQVAELLDKTVDDRESDAFVSWLLDAAESTCAAAHEGAKLGFGGSRISPREEAFLAQLSSALRHSRTSGQTT